MSFNKLIKIFLHLLLWFVLAFGSIFHETTVYLIAQSYGQFYLITHTKSFEAYAAEKNISSEHKRNLALISEIKKYSVDSLNYKPTKNFTEIYDQENAPVLWVITASSPYKIEPYYWRFPVVGKVSYKGFFNKQKAEALKNKLICEGYDVDSRSVSAWSTLGWFSDPVLSNMLNKSKGNLCNLIFHELFHATYYAESSVDFNENLAFFIAHKATLQFLRNDSTALKIYLGDGSADYMLMEDNTAAQLAGLNRFYDSISVLPESQKYILKLRKITHVAKSYEYLGAQDKEWIKTTQNHILSFKNAWFVDFIQYRGLQDSLEEVFNKIYQGNLPKMVQSLKQKSP